MADIKCTRAQNITWIYYRKKDFYVHKTPIKIIVWSDEILTFHVKVMSLTTYTPQIQSNMDKDMQRQKKSKLK